ncbi:MAG: exodeoxyribonuclease V subunit gamma [Acidobacteriota bacterium]
MFHLHTSNRLDVLVEHLADTLQAEPVPPLEREVIVVQSQGMQRWVSLQLADRLGIAAGLTMPFPGPFCAQLADHLLDGNADTRDDPSGQPASLFDRDLLTWRLFDRLPDLAGPSPENAAHHRASPGAYLAEDADDIKRYQLAARLAGLFADYQLFRPEMLLAWQTPGMHLGHPDEVPPQADWQAELWRALTAEHPAELEEEPLASRLLHLLEFLQSRRGAPPGLPSRLSVFGVSSLPPIFIRIVAALARFVPVRLYFTSPTYHYWGDLRSERETATIRRRLRGRQRGTGKSLAETHLEVGHPLLAGLGRQGRDFFNLLQEADPEGHAWHELEFVELGGDALLHTLQADILHLVDRGGAEVPKRRLAADDVSLSIHACHSPRREMEVLRDQLLQAFELDSELRPADVLVMVPDIAEYSPYIEAVFGVDWDGSPKLPYSIADRRATQESPLAETFLQVLDLIASRVAPRAVLDLLDTPAIRRAFDISAGDVPVLRQWIRDAGIRWAMDGAQRAADFDLPGDNANTWRAGLDRLLMGYAAGDRAELVGGVAPQAGSTAGNAELLGNLASFVDTLFGHLRHLDQPREADSWANDLGRLLDDLFVAQNEDEETALEWLREDLADLAEARTTAGVEVRLSLAVLRAHLTRILGSSSSRSGRGFGSGFIKGRITFCALKPMRTIPFEVICIAGLSEGAFPRRDTRRSFDLMAWAPRLGDRSVREDDRYLFLETLLAARQRLILTYEGRSQRDNRRKAPAVVISELLDALDRGFVTEDGEPARQQVVVEHRLHPFSSDYYGASLDRRLFSYSQENYRASHGQASRSEVSRNRGSRNRGSRNRGSRNRGSRNRGGRPGDSPFLPIIEDDESPAEGAAVTPGGEVDQTAHLEIELPELIELWINPARHYCRKVLQLFLVHEERQADDAEPFVIDPLQRYQINQWLLSRRLPAPPGEDSALAAAAPETPERDPEAELELLRGRGELPLARLGKAHFAGLDAGIESFVATLPSYHPRGPQWTEVSGEDWRLRGRIEELTDVGTLRFRCANLKPKDQLHAWIVHVVRNVWEDSHPSGLPLTTHVIGNDRGVRFGRLPDAAQILASLVDGYRLGLEQPLPVFELASHAYARQRLQLADAKSRARTPALEVARRAWQGERRRGDRDDPYIALCFRDLDPLADGAFKSWADRLWRPLLRHAEEG